MRRITLLLSLLLAALWLSSCSSTPSTGSSSTPTPSTSASPTTSSAASPTTQSGGTATTSSGSKSSVAVANAYYQALKDKDYNKAFSYLDASAVNAQGQTLAQSVFVQLAQARDQESGPIQSYDAQPDSTDPTMVIMTISRPQDQRYHSHLQVKNGKIVSLDII